MNKELVQNIVCNGKRFVIVKLDKSAHIMSIDEWKWVFDQLRPGRWGNGGRVRK